MRVQTPKQTQATLNSEAKHGLAREFPHDYIMTCVMFLCFVAFHHLAQNFFASLSSCQSQKTAISWLTWAELE